MNNLKSITSEAGVTSTKKVSNKKLGSAWENTFDMCARIQGFYVTKIYDGHIKVGAGKMIPRAQDFDRVIWKDGRAIAIDCKTVQGETFAYASLNLHQQQALLEIEGRGCRAGYALFFRKPGKVVFLSAGHMRDLTTPKSAHWTDGMLLGDLTDMDINLLL